MRRNIGTTCALGASLALLTAGAASLGLFDPLEDIALDAQFRYARTQADPISEQIAHVDIDDGALDSIGQWPWPRELVADALLEIERAGARTIALDILFLEPEREDDAGGDEALARALAQAPAALAVDLRTRREFADIWSDEPAQADLDELLDLLATDIQIDPAVAADTVDLTPSQRSRFLARPLAYKEAALDRALDRAISASMAPPTMEDFAMRVAPRQHANVGGFPEQALIERAWRRGQSIKLLARFMRSTESGDEPVDGLLPLPQLLASARAAGFVNFTHTLDGAVRRVPAFASTRRGDLLQFGLAAAALHAGLSPDDLTITRDSLSLGEITLPLSERDLTIAWPTTPTDWSGALVRDGDDSETAGHISIGALVSIAESRRTIASLQSELEGVRDEIAMELFDKTDLTEQEQADLADEIEFRLEDVQFAEGEWSLTKEELDLVAPYVHHSLLQAAIRDGRAELIRAQERARDALADKLVFVGWTATGASADFVRTPLGPATPGVVVQAAIADMALTGRAVHAAPRLWAFVLPLTMGLLASLLTLTRTRASMLLFVLLEAAYIAGAGWLAFDAKSLSLPVVAPVVSAGLCWIACTALAAALARREKSRITRQFSARVSPQLVQRLVDQPGAITVEGVEREATVLFLDLAGFTALSERLDSAATVHLLNTVMGRLTRVLTDHRAYVNKFLGDGLLAFWSAFDEEPDQAALACAAAIQCAQAMEEINEKGALPTGCTLTIRVGVATGPVIIGDCGAPPQLHDYTAIGDTVNLAARLESANKQLGSRMIIDGRTRELVGDAGTPLRSLGAFVVIGQTTPVDVHELISEESSTRLSRGYESAIRSFQSGDLDAARREWKTIAERGEAEALAALYLEAIDEARDGRVACAGAVALKSK